MSTGILVLLFGGILATAIAAIILRAACSLFNRLFGGSRVQPNQQPEFSSVKPAVSQVQVDANGDSNPYAAPATTALPTTTAYSNGIPEPSFGKAFGIIFISWMVQMLLQFASSLIPGGLGSGSELVVSLLMLLINFGVVAGLLNQMLPTTFGKGAAVAALYLAICLLIGVAIFAVAFVFFVSSMPRYG